jgi:hypothetical protein
LYQPTVETALARSNRRPQECRNYVLLMLDLFSGIRSSTPDCSCLSQQRTMHATGTSENIASAPPLIFAKPTIYFHVFLKIAYKILSLETCTYCNTPARSKCERTCTTVAERCACSVRAGVLSVALRRLPIWMEKLTRWLPGMGFVEVDCSRSYSLQQCHASRGNLESAAPARPCTLLLAS